MLVKAKWNVKDAAGWHSAGEVFHTDEDLGDAVEVIEGKKPAAQKEEKAPEKMPEPAEEVKAEKPKTTSRRKKTGN